MTASKSTNRPVRAGAGGSRRLGREEVADLELFFVGKQASAWCILLPRYGYAQTEIVVRWRQWHNDHPGETPPHVGAWLAENSTDTKGETS